MKVVVFGATGMVGDAALIECLEDDSIEKVLVVGRRGTRHQHEKLSELLHSDFLDFSAVESRLSGYDACIYCVGISSVGVTEAEYRRVTLDFTVAAGQVLVRQNPEMRMCFVSGAGTDANSSQMWARVKAEAEQALLAMPFKSVHMFRPAMIMPRKGVTSNVTSYRIGYKALGWTYPLLKTLARNYVTTSDQLGRALIRVAREGHSLSILEGADINALSP